MAITFSNNGDIGVYGDKESLNEHASDGKAGWVDGTNAAWICMLLYFGKLYTFTRSYIDLSAISINGEGIT
jgi:hypothetical protein